MMGAKKAFDPTNRTTSSVARLLFAVYVVAIYVSLPFLRQVVEGIRHLAGGQGIAALTLAAAGGAGALLGLLGLRAGHAARVLPRMAGILAGGVVILLLLRENPVEQIHLVEYGLLGWLGQRASGHRSGGERSALIVWGVLVLSAGAVDEVIQHFLPNRIFDWRDVGVNAASGLLGMAAATLLPFDSPPARNYND